MANGEVGQTDRKAALHSRVDVDFATHQMNEEQQARVGAIRRGFQSLAHDAVLMLPDSRELSLVISKLEEASFYAVAGVAREGARHG